MKEILGDNLKGFFDTVDSKFNEAEITYAGNRYEVWEVSDDLFKKMCDMSEEEFVKLAGNDAWWRSAEGSVLGIPRARAIVNGKPIVCWDDDYYLPDEYEEEPCKEFDSLTEYLCECVGASTEKNVCACVVDLAKYNNMTMGQLFREYEGKSK